MKSLSSYLTEARNVTKKMTLKQFLSWRMGENLKSLDGVDKEALLFDMTANIEGVPNGGEIDEKEMMDLLKEHFDDKDKIEVEFIHNPTKVSVYDVVFFLLYNERNYTWARFETTSQAVYPKYE